MMNDTPDGTTHHCPQCERLQRELDKKTWKSETDCEILWLRLMQEAKHCQRNWGMGFPVISTELLRKYWHEATGFMPPERTREIPQR